MIKRNIFRIVKGRLSENRKFIQALFGPRQVGKTTLALQLCQELDMPNYYASADTVTLQDNVWLEQQWYTARKLIKNKQPALLVIDEIQKIANWSSIVKRFWDEDTANQIPLHVIILGSSPWLMQKGLTESLAGRFELIPVTHWSFTEMQQSFDFELNQFIYFGGYPGAASLIKDEKRWQDYVNNSLIETTVSRDILLMSQINKPILLRRLFQLGCHYSGQILSYQKMIGQL